MIDTAKDQARAQYESIVAMVAALDVNYDRLSGLVDEFDAFLTDNPTGESRCIESFDGREELEQLQDATNGCENYDAAVDRIQEDPLSVEVRSGWCEAGHPDGLVPEEFSVLLCTGGPAVRIVGTLDELCQPDSAHIEYQDWGTPWVWLEQGVDQAVLLRYCEQFYFGG